MIVCPSCGTENADGSNFCFNCGTQLERATGAAARPVESADAAAVVTLDEQPPALDPAYPSSQQTSSTAPEPSDQTVVAEAPAAAPPPRPSAPPIPPPVSLPPRAASGLPATSPEWRMSDAGPLPAPRGRRRWLWITLGLLGACLLICVVAVTLVSTVFRDEFDTFLATVEAGATAESSPD